MIECIEAMCRKRLGRRPNMEDPTGYNDKIQWLKLHDQRKEQITACDKWAVRDMIPAQYRIPARLGIAPDLFPAFVKCTHDSGSARRVETERDAQQAVTALQPRLARPYGVEKGEWAYQFVTPRIVTERALDTGTDYKFHCVHGRIRWVQVIRDRANGAKETITNPLGRTLPLHMDHKMQHVPESVYPGDREWLALAQLAERLAEGWRYVRVDLYWDGQPWFGELTFWPLSGCYLTKDEPAFGEMLDIDLSEKLEPVC